MTLRKSGTFNKQEKLPLPLFHSNDDDDDENENNSNKKLFNIVKICKRNAALPLLPNYAHKQFVLEMDEKNGKEMNPKCPWSLY